MKNAVLLVLAAVVSSCGSSPAPAPPATAPTPTADPTAEPTAAPEPDVSAAPAASAPPLKGCPAHLQEFDDTLATSTSECAKDTDCLCFADGLARARGSECGGVVDAP